MSFHDICFGLLSGFSSSFFDGRYFTEKATPAEQERFEALRARGGGSGPTERVRLWKERSDLEQFLVVGSGMEASRDPMNLARRKAYVLSRLRELGGDNELGLFRCVCFVLIC